MKPKEKSFFNQAQYHEAFTKRVLKKIMRIKNLKKKLEIQSTGARKPKEQNVFREANLLMSLVVSCATLLPPSLRQKPISPNSLTTTTTRFYDDRQTAKIPSSSDHLLPCFFLLIFNNGFSASPDDALVAILVRISSPNFRSKFLRIAAAFFRRAHSLTVRYHSYTTYQTSGRYLPNKW